MSIAKKLIAAIMFMMYLFAFSKAAFGSEDNDSLIRSKPILTNKPVVIQSIMDLKHKCLQLGETELLVIEVLVDKRGFVSEYKIPGCDDKKFQKELKNEVEHMVFVPAFSIAGVPVPYVYKLELELAANL